ncbi:MAG: adenylyltransferase/cytidyltransferase family protein [Candidatus Marinimicrobia bacterium]|jgi:D-beta-D-heptose 7-phosphate kinase/D-beta-D-heptose 1-phosphate adenosyltransferase|nr:adenylyltransferase/cytidyltransferase family protein [Candidatus Neomarinimicrobiota bacterium]
MSNDILAKMDGPIVVVVSGGFDPVHEGHLYLINEANKLAKSKYDSVIVGVNSDDWLIRKKGFSFMRLNERLAVMSAIKGVQRAMPFNDRDDTAIDLLNKVKKEYINHNILFANGGDRGPSNIPEMVVDDIVFKFGVGGKDKPNSSSNIVDRFIKTLYKK